jgi:nitrate reductase gamma subunit
VTTLLYVAIPYACLTSFVVGLFWRYRYDKFGWTTRSSQLYEGRQLALASPLFHFGILAVFAGHFIGLLVPATWTDAIGISESMYHTVAALAGAIAGIAAATGLAMLVYRRRLTRSIFQVTTPMDKAMYVVLGTVIALGLINTIALNALGMGHDYRADVSVWIRSILLLQPQPDLMAVAPLSFQLHGLAAFALIALWPFTRLVHVFSVPLGYVARPYVVYRTRDPRAGVRAPRRGWEPPGS